MKTIYAIEGTFCAGKTSACNILKRRGYKIYLEPELTWDESFRAYMNMPDCVSAALLQHEVGKDLEERSLAINRLKDEEPERVCIMEQSHLSAFHVFIQNNMFRYPGVQWNDVYAKAVDNIQKYERNNCRVVYIGLPVTWEIVKERTKLKCERDAQYFEEEYFREIYQMYTRFFTKHCNYLLDADYATSEVIADKIGHIIRYEELPVQERYVE